MVKLSWSIKSSFHRNFMPTLSIFWGYIKSRKDQKVSCSIIHLDSNFRNDPNVSIWSSNELNEKAFSDFEYNRYFKILIIIISKYDVWGYSKFYLRSKWSVIPVSTDLDRISEWDLFWFEYKTLLIWSG